MASQQYPEPTVGALIFNREDRLLLVRSHKLRDQYVIPGGHIELGETMEQALRREILEETGLRISDIRYIGMQEFIYDEVFWEKRHFIFHDFACRADDCCVRLNEEAQSFVWATLEECDALPVEPYTLRAIREYQRQMATAASARS